MFISVVLQNTVYIYLFPFQLQIVTSPTQRHVHDRCECMRECVHISVCACLCAPVLVLYRKSIFRVSSKNTQKAEMCRAFGKETACSRVMTCAKHRKKQRKRLFSTSSYCHTCTLDRNLSLSASMWTHPYSLADNSKECL